MENPERNNHYSTFDELLPYLRVGNGIEDGETGLKAKVDIFKRGARMDRPGVHHKRGVKVKPALDPELRKKGYQEEIIWIDSIASRQNTRRYKRLRIIKRAA